MLNKKTLIRLDDSYCMHQEYYEKAKETFRKIAAEKTVVVLGVYRDELNCSRKIALALLEHFDKKGFTRKNGEGRILR